MADQEGAKRTKRKRAKRQKIKPSDECVFSSSGSKSSPTPNLDEDEEYFRLVVATNIKKFLELGLLDGMVVSCFEKTPIIGKTPYVGKAGKIVGAKIYCLCEVCKRIVGWPTTMFEKHAGCLKKYPAKSFYFDNGKTVKDVMDKCKESPYASWGEAIHALLEDVYDPTLFRLGHVCIICKGLIPHEGTDVAKSVCNVCLPRNESSPDDTTVAGQELAQDTQKVLAAKSSTASGAQSSNSGLNNDQHGPLAYINYMDEKVLAAKSTTASRAQCSNSGLNNDQHGPLAYKSHMDEFMALYHTM